MSVIVSTSADALVDDIDAFFHSYLIAVSVGGNTILQMPVAFITWLDSIRAIPPTAYPLDVEALLQGRRIAVQLSSCGDLSSSEFQYPFRWPFFVKRTLSVEFSIGERWASFEFYAGRTYGDLRATVGPQELVALQEVAG